MYNKAYHKKWHKAWYQKNRKKRNKQTLDYYYKIKTTKKFKQRQKTYNLKNKKKRIKVSIAWNKAHPKLARKRVFEYLRTVNGRYSRFKYNAKRRGLLCSITKEYFSFLIEDNCFYCKTPPKLAVGYGIDRLNNKKGYTFKNVVPCCKICNHMKRDLSFKDFIIHIKRINHHHNYELGAK